MARKQQRSFHDESPNPVDGNQILAALPDAVLRRLGADSATVKLAFGQVLYRAGDRKRYVYFPLTTYISQVETLRGKPKIEVGLVGHEGMVGSSLLLNVDQAPFHTVVQGAGSALRIEAAHFVHELGRGSDLQAVMNRYQSVRISQLGQMIACVRFHTVEERLARWLLMTRDRARSDTFHLTHEYMALMLGVRRVGITEAATELQDRRLIRYSRGNITVVNADALQRSSCECYATATATYRQHMG